MVGQGLLVLTCELSHRSSLEVLPSQVYSLVGSSPLRTTSSYNSLVPVQDQHQPIIIPDTPSPPVSVITIRSDTDEEGASLLPSNH